jgi:hypothetical protein
MIDEAVFDLGQLAESVAPAPQKRRAVLAAAVAAAAIVLAVGIVVADRNGGNVVTDAVSSPSDVEPAPPAVAEPGSSLWSLVFHDEAVFGGKGDHRMFDVAVGGPGLVAVGHQEACTDYVAADGEVIGEADPLTICDDNNAVVWTSPDGLTWSLAANVATEPALTGSSWVSALNATNGRLVAVGSHSPNRDSGGAAVWTSPNP